MHSELSWDADLAVLWGEDGPLPPFGASIERALRCAYALYAGIRAQVEIALLDQAEPMREINRAARGIDDATDVLSFPSLALKRPTSPERLRTRGRSALDPETGRIALGDVLICVERAQEQALAYGHSIEREMAFLAVHGFLHLLGYDHADEGGEIAMRAMQEAALASAGLSRGHKHEIDDDTLLRCARDARANAYAPYSNYTVGVCLLAASGKTYTGVNVENASYPVTLCAERAALASAITQGERDFVAIAISAQTLPLPCGMCRQALYEFAPRLRILAIDDLGAQKITSLPELLPEAFGPDSLNIPSMEEA